MRRLRIIDSYGDPVDAVEQFIIGAQLLSQGFTLEGKVCDSVLGSHDTWYPVLQELVGGHCGHAPLFRDFPRARNSHHKMTLERLFGSASAGQWAYLFDQFSLQEDPFRGMEGLRKALRSEAAKDPDSIGNTRPVRCVSRDEFDKEISTWALQQIEGASAIQTTLWPDLKIAMKYCDLQPTNIPIRENRAYFAAYLLEDNRILEAYWWLESATDVLRFFAARTDSDVSLKEPITFPKLSRPERRLVCEALSRDIHLAENLLAYEGLWKAVGKGLHPIECGFYDVADLFAALRSKKRTEAMRTWFSVMESLIKNGSDKELILHMEQRPAVFARSLERLLRLRGEPMLSGFYVCATSVPLKTLQVLKSHLLRPKATERMVTLKSGKVKILPEINRPEESLRIAAAEVIEDTIRVLTTTKEVGSPYFTGKKVYVDPASYGIVAPYQQRKASDGMEVIPRGSRLPLAANGTLRLFVYWKGGADLDLSVIFDYRDGHRRQVSYTCLSEAKIIHSGDILSAPCGATEFIDIPLDWARKNLTRLYAQVYTYREGHESDDLFGGSEEVFTGWMVRKDTDGKAFDPKTVENTMKLNRKASYALPVMLDFTSNEMVILDVYSRRSLGIYSRTESEGTDAAATADQIAIMTQRRPTIETVVVPIVSNRGAILVDTADEADIVIGTRNTGNVTIDVTDPGAFSEYFG